MHPLEDEQFDVQFIQLDPQGISNEETIPFFSYPGLFDFFGLMDSFFRKPIESTPCSCAARKG